MKKCDKSREPVNYRQHIAEPLQSVTLPFAVIQQNMKAGFGLHIYKHAYNLLLYSPKSNLACFIKSSNTIEITQNLLKQTLLVLCYKKLISLLMNLIKFNYFSVFKLKFNHLLNLTFFFRLPRV